MTFGEQERTAWTGKRRADICTRAELLVRVCDNSTKRYKNIYINKEKIPLDLSLSLSLSLLLLLLLLFLVALSLSLSSFTFRAWSIYFFRVVFNFLFPFPDESVR